MTEIVEESDQLGVKTNKEKFSPFLEEQKYVGFIWNGFNKTIELYLKLGAMFKYNKVEVLVGRLNHVTYMLPQLQCYLCSPYKWLSEWMDKRASQTVPEDVEEDLNTWLTTLKNFSSTRLIASSAPTNIVWVGNVSTGFGIGIIIGR
ncbi:hypothetical protein PSTG_10964 [Puccinia striiformis f. sp. tritici PST-78]|uniref:Uncharacterized protein n=1 Tax=Puccinia striiformis f. sp. tritici PST-78 TaxID=1165861 RepID=A0A0L0V8Z2_9BASI|nr:hypothetical protein PSTG_10964 [Puccinia striiformis f. sp. tritici PST-78]